MGRSFQSVDKATGHSKLGPAQIDYDFDVTAEGGQTDFSIPAGVLKTDSYVRVLMNGVKVREGVASDRWQRNVAQNKIVMNTAAPKNAWLSVEIYF